MCVCVCVCVLCVCVVCGIYMVFGMYVPMCIDVCSLVVVVMEVVKVS